MKKTAVLILVLAVLLVAAPVHAAETDQGWYSGFAKFFQMFGLFKDQMPASDGYTSVKLSPTVTVTDEDTTDKNKTYGNPEGNWPTKTYVPSESRPTKIWLPAENRPTKEDQPSEARPTKTWIPTGTVRPTKEDLPNESRPVKTWLPATDARAKKEMLPPENRPTKNLSPDNADAARSEKSEQKHSAVALSDVTDRILGSYEKRISNYTDFLTKVRSRRDKLATQGSDTTKLNAFIASASDNLRDAGTKLSTVKKAVNTLDTKKSVGDTRATLKPLLTELRQAMTGLHKSMSETVHEIVSATSALREAAGNAPDSKEKGRPEETWSAAHTPKPKHSISVTPSEKGKSRWEDAGGGN